MGYMTFNLFNLESAVLDATASSGYTTPTDIQSKAIPVIMQGSDIRASAQTGTGKTGAFLLPMLNRLITTDPKSGKGPRVLILVPTRELALQVQTQTNKYAKFLPNIKTSCIIGGVPYKAQKQILPKPHDVMIATPGRLMDLMDQGVVHFERVEMLILDEADRMLDMGFLSSVEEIVAKIPSPRQTLLFSATLQGSVMKFSERLLTSPVDIRIDIKHNYIEQTLYYVKDLHHKNRLLNEILSQEDITRAIIFTSTKRHAEKLVSELAEQDHEVAALHGDMGQRQRAKTILNLQKGRIRILVATDVASRGIDVPSISHVINFDLPRCGEDYTHRIGRTGRAGARGKALSFAARGDMSSVKNIEDFTGQKIHPAEGQEPPPRMSPRLKPRLKPQLRSRSKINPTQRFKKKMKKR